MSRIFVLVSAFLTLAFTSPPAVAAQRVVVGGELTGATGIDVNGTLYDVSFSDGTCATLFSGCEDQADFLFDFSAGQAAAYALLTQVFFESPQGLGIASPWLPRGCSLSECYSLIPVNVQFGGVDAVAVANLDENEFDSVFRSRTSPDSDFAVCPNCTFAVFSLAAALPEPGTWATMLLGFGAIGLALRRRGKSTTVARLTQGPRARPL